MSSVILHFVDRDDKTLFTTVADCVPQPGDTVSYIMEAKDEEKWMPSHWQSRMDVSCKDWRVIKTWHHFRCLSADRPKFHQIFVQVSLASKHTAGTEHENKDKV